MAFFEICKPYVPNKFLLIFAGMTWECVGVMLISLAFSWLSSLSGGTVLLFMGAGALSALLIHHFGFLKIVNKNSNRILHMEGKKCLFSFFPLKSYLLIIVMILMGAVLRHSSIPKKYLAVLYLGIGLALILSSIRYLRIFFVEMRRK